MEKIIHTITKLLYARGFSGVKGDTLFIDQLSNKGEAVLLGEGSRATTIVHIMRLIVDHQDRKHYENSIKIIVSMRAPKVDLIIVVPPDIDYKELSDSEHITIFSELDLGFDPTENDLVPIHERVDSCPLINGHVIDPMHLPLMEIKDPISKWYGYKRGDIIKITRNYSDEIYYRRIMGSSEI